MEQKVEQVCHILISMDESWEKWLFDMENDCHLFNEYNIMNSFEEELIINGENLLQSELSLEGQSSNSNVSTENTHVAVAAGNNNTMNNSSLEENTGDFSLNQHASSEEPLLLSPMSHILSLEESTVVAPNSIPKETHDDQHSKENREELQNRKSKRCRNSSQIQDHIIAERKRRENLTKLFVALSAVIPGLKKMDKASIMKNAINYVKYLQKSVKDLQEQNMKRKNMESVVCLRNEKSNIVTVADNYKPLNRSPIIEVRVLAKDVFIRVVCENRKNVLVKLLAKLEAHNLSVVGSNTIPFGNSTLNITITARVDNDFSMTKDELVKKLMEDLLETYD